MKKIYFIFLISLFFLTNFAYGEESTRDIFGKVNNQNLYLNDFNRLLNAQKKKFHNSLNFDLFSTSNNTEATLKREEHLKKARSEGLSQTSDEFNNTWYELVEKSGGYEGLENKAKEKNLTILDVKNKLKENIALDKYFEKHIKNKIIEIMINEQIALEEAKKRNLQVNEAEIQKRLDFIKGKQGSEEGFKAFLEENNATIEDVKNEIKNQMLYDQLKNKLVKENTNFKAFLNKKKLESNIIVYNDKIQPQVQKIKVQATNPEIRTNEYPTLTKTKVEDIKKLEEKTNEIIQEIKEAQKPSESEKTTVTASKTKLSFKFNLPKLSKIKKEENKDTLLIKANSDDFEKHIKQRKTVIIEEENIGNVNPEPVVIEPINKKSKLSRNSFKNFKKIKGKIDKIKLSLQQARKPEIKTEIVEQTAQKIESPELRPLLPSIKADLPIQASVSQPSKLDSLSKEIEELRRKIEQRRISVNK